MGDTTAIEDIAEMLESNQNLYSDDGKQLRNANNLEDDLRQKVSEGSVSAYLVSQYYDAGKKSKK